MIRIFLTLFIFGLASTVSFGNDLPTLLPNTATDLANVQPTYEHVVTPNQQALDFIDQIEWHHLPSSESLTGGSDFEPTSIKNFFGQVVLFMFFDTDNMLYHQYQDRILQLQQKFPEDITFIGLFPHKNQGDSNQNFINHAISKHGLNYMIGSYDVQKMRTLLPISTSTPQFIAVGPDGYYMSGLTRLSQLKQLSETLFSQIPDLVKKRKIFPKTKVINQDQPEVTVLKHPTFISIDSAKKQLAISDTGHHRVIITNEDGEIIDIIGNGRATKKNNAFETASMSHPAGLVFVNDALYIADAGNRQIRVADLTKRTLSTLEPIVPTKPIFLNSGPFMVPHDLKANHSHLFISYPSLGSIMTIDLASQEADAISHDSLSMQRPTSLFVDNHALKTLDTSQGVIHNLKLQRNHDNPTRLAYDIEPIGDNRAMALATSLTLHRGRLYALHTSTSTIHELDQVQGISKKSFSLYDAMVDYNLNDPSFDPNLIDDQSWYPYLVNFIAVGDSFYIVDAANHCIWIYHKYTGNIKKLSIYI